MANEAMVLDPSASRSRPGVLASALLHWRMILAFCLVGAILGYLVSFVLPTSYTAQSSVFFSVAAPFDPTDELGDDQSRFTADQVELIRTDEVLDRAGKRVNPPVPLEEVREAVTTAGSIETDRVTVTVILPDAEQARALADAIAASYRETAREHVVTITSRVQDAITDPSVEALLLAKSAAYGDGVRAVEPAVLPETPSAPLPLQNALIAAALGLFAGLGVGVLRDQRRARHATVADLDLLIGAPLISRYAAPASRSLHDVVRTKPEDTQSVHDVLAAIDVALEGRKNASVLFLSWQRALTTTSLVASTGFVAAQAGREVALIDGGMKQPGISALTDVDPGLGLEALADPKNPIDGSLRSWNVGRVSLRVVPINGWAPSRAGAAARPQVLRAATDRLHTVAPLVLVDGPPLGERSVGLALGRGVDAVVLVVDEETSIDDAHEIGRRIALAGVGLLGYVLVGPAHAGLMKGSRAPMRRYEGSALLSETEEVRRV